MYSNAWYKQVVQAKLFLSMLRNEVMAEES